MAGIDVDSSHNEHWEDQSLSDTDVENDMLRVNSINASYQDEPLGPQDEDDIVGDEADKDSITSFTQLTGDKLTQGSVLGPLRGRKGQTRQDKDGLSFATIEARYESGAVAQIKENGNKTSEKDESFSKSESSQQYGMGSNSEEHRKATEDRNSRENNSNYTSENFESNTSNTNNGSWMTTINVMSGGIVVLGDRAVINTSNAAPQQSHKTGEENVFSKRSRFSNKSYRTSVQEPSNSSVPVRRDPRVCTPLSAEEALKQGLERYTSEFHEDFRDELAAKLGNHSGIVANWVDVARALKLESKAIQRIEDKGTAHRLLFMKVRDCQPELKLSEIKDILENKMKRKPRRDIFYDYEKNKDLPSLDNKIGDLSDNEFEMVLENVADRLVTERVRGNWRNLGGFLGFTPPELDEIMNEGRPENFTGSARMFIDFLGYRFKKVREVVGALESDQVKRQDLALFMREHLKRDDCWIESCALQSHNKSKTP